MREKNAKNDGWHQQAVANHAEPESSLSAVLPPLFVVGTLCMAVATVAAAIEQSSRDASGDVRYGWFAHGCTILFWLGAACDLSGFALCGGAIVTGAVQGCAEAWRSFMSDVSEEDTTNNDTGPHSSV